MITYLVEGLGSAPAAPYVDVIEVSADGKPLKVRGDCGGTVLFDYSNFKGIPLLGVPKVSDPKRATIVQRVIAGSVTNDQLSFVMEVGFGKDVQKFRFDSVRLR